MNDTLTILNYPGCKKRLLEFIKTAVEEVLPRGKTVFDVFCGTSAVGYGLKKKYRVMSNDAEIFCYTISKALVGNNKILDFNSIKEKFLSLFTDNKLLLEKAYPEVESEANFIGTENVAELVAFYKQFKTVTNPEFVSRNVDSQYHLFTDYYSNSYFGLQQSIEIDSLRYAIEYYRQTEFYDALTCCLYYAMKECVFSKDGHMAQPLNLDKDCNVLLKRRSKSIVELFTSKMTEFANGDFATNGYTNECYNLTLSEVLESGLIDKADLVYADPPYTDMQYSRYFHLLETVTRYDYPEISCTNGKVSTGLYRANRFQSPLSQHSTAKTELEKLISYCATHNKKLVLSYAYPKNPEQDKKNRYVTSIDELVELFHKHYGKVNTSVRSMDFEHCNNRNSETKKVYEYLIIGDLEHEAAKLPENADCDELVEKTIAEINQTVGTNNSPIYNSHLYWSQKPYNICDILLKNLSNTGDVVCDPFMGSGVTVIQSLSNNLSRRPIGIEVNDYPIYLVKSLLAKYDVAAFVEECAALLEELSQVEAQLYSTTCPHCGRALTVDKSTFSYANNGAKKLEAVYAQCSHCKKTVTSCTADDVTSFSRYDNDVFHHFENISLIPNSRIAVRENETLYDIFTKRNVKAIDSILAAVKNKKFYQLYVYSLVGIMHLCKITDPKSNSQWPLWTPHHDCVEKNVIKLFVKSLKRTKDAITAVKEKIRDDRYLAHSFDGLHDGGYYVVKDGAQCIDGSVIPDNSVDLVITDPPYLGHVIYSEYMQLYKPFLKTEIEYDKEIIVIRTKDRVKTEKDYFAEIDKAFAQISRFLKPNKYLCLYFHDASLRIWNKLLGILNDNGLQFVGLTHVNNKKVTLKNIVSPKKSMNGDAILFFKKSDNPTSASAAFSEERVIELATNIIINNNGKATTAQLYDNGVLAYLIKTNTLDVCARKYSDLTKLFAKYLTWNTEGYWTVKED